MAIKAVGPCKKPATRTPILPLRMSQAVAMPVHTSLARAFEAACTIIMFDTSINEGTDSWFVNLSPRGIRDGCSDAVFSNLSSVGEDAGVHMLLW
jgi:hypothetical protein